MNLGSIIRMLEVLLVDAMHYYVPLEFAMLSPF